MFNLEESYHKLWKFIVNRALESMLHTADVMNSVLLNIMLT